MQYSIGKKSLEIIKLTIKYIIFSFFIISIAHTEGCNLYNRILLIKKIRNINEGPQKKLYLAIINDDLKLLDEALEEGADPDYDGYIIKGEYIPPPLYYAIKNENILLLQILILEGANVNKGIGKECTSPLFFAIEKGNCKIIGILLGYGAHLNNIKKCSYNNIISNYSDDN